MARLDNPPIAPPEGDEQPFYRSLIREWREGLVDYLRITYADIVARLDTLETHSNVQVGARAYASTAQAVGTAHTQVTLGAENYDVGGDFTASTFTCPLAGRYLIVAQIRLAVGADGDLILATIERNGVSIATKTIEVGGASSQSFGVSTVWDCAIGDTIKLYVQNANTNDTVKPGQQYTFMAVEYLGT